MLLVNPFKYRPTTYDELGWSSVESLKDWDDNPVSNLLAYLSDATNFSKGCEGTEHDSPLIWLAEKMWTSCSCCYFLRGVLVGSFVTLTIQGVAYGLLR